MLIKTYYHINHEDSCQRKSILWSQSYCKAIKTLTFRVLSPSKFHQWPHIDLLIINVNIHNKLIKVVISRVNKVQLKQIHTAGLALADRKSVV